MQFFFRFRIQDVSGDNPKYPGCKLDQETALMGTFFATLVKGNSAIVASGCQYSTTKSRMLDQKSSSFSRDETVNQTVKSISFWHWDRSKTETPRIPQNKGSIHKSEDLLLSQDIGKENGEMIDALILAESTPYLLLNFARINGSQWQLSLYTRIYFLQLSS